MRRARNLATVVLATTAFLLGWAPPVNAASLDRDNLVSLAEVDAASSREDWHTIPWRRRHTFDCGALAVMSTFRQLMVRRAYDSDDQAGATAVAMTHRSNSSARAAHRRTVATIRSCARGVGYGTLTADEQQRLPGRARLLQIYFAPPEVGTDTWSFVVVQRGRRTSLVTMGAGGRTPRHPLRALVSAASERLIR